jgi:hypothetical protein
VDQHAGLLPHEKRISVLARQPADPADGELPMKMKTAILLLAVITVTMAAGTYEWVSRWQRQREYCEMMKNFRGNEPIVRYWSCP